MTDGGAPIDPTAGDRLTQAAQVRREAEGLRARLVAAGQHAEATTEQVQRARDALGEEERDVERLESLSWSRIRSGLTARTGTDRERETAERDAARYTLAAAEARNEVAWRDVESIQAQLDALGDVDAAFDQALAAQEEWATTHDAGAARELGEIAERRGELQVEDAEAREAFDAGAVARGLLVQAAEQLDSAAGWSTWDTFGGGGMLTDLMKHDRLDDVTRLLQQVEVALGRFSRELADLHLVGVDSVRVQGWDFAFDVFFDNIFSDYAVRQRISDAQRAVGETLARVEHTLQGLSARGREIAAELESLARRREERLQRPDA